MCQNAVTAQAKYESSQVAVQSSMDAFTLMQAKYENGKANITEFNEAKNSYLRAESDCVQARYELLYQQALILSPVGEAWRVFTSAVQPLTCLFRQRRGSATGGCHSAC